MVCHAQTRDRGNVTYFSRALLPGESFHMSYRSSKSEHCFLEKGWLQTDRRTDRRTLPTSVGSEEGPPTKVSGNFTLIQGYARGGKGSFPPPLKFRAQKSQSGSLRSPTVPETTVSSRDISLREYHVFDL